MKNLNRYTSLSILLLALIYVGGCAPTTTAPREWFPLHPTSPEKVAVNTSKSILPDAKSIINERIGLRLGVLGTSIPSIDINVIPGAELGLSFGKGPLIVDLNSRFFSGSDQDPKFTSFSAAIGGRYHFLHKRNISPYLGGGLTWSYMHYEKVERELRKVCLDWDWEFVLFIPIPVCKEWGHEWRDILYMYEGRGFGAYGIIGVEFLHLHQSRFNLELRIDNPFYELESNSHGSQRSISLDIPISLGISLLHQF